MKAYLGLGVLLLVTVGHPACAGDREDVLGCVNRYIKYEESGHFLAQGELMTDGRTMVYPGGRAEGDNRKGMKEQQAQYERFAREFPGVHYDIELRDVQVQTWNGDSAMVVFETLPRRIVPPSLSPQILEKLGPPKSPLIVAAMLVKQGGVWKITHTTFVPRDKN